MQDGPATPGWPWAANPEQPGNGGHPNANPTGIR
jgi:hypothetical protein